MKPALAQLEGGEVEVCGEESPGSGNESGNSRHAPSSFGLLKSEVGRPEEADAPGSPYFAGLMGRVQSSMDKSRAMHRNDSQHFAQDESLP
jgi:hypothetical protein